MYQQPIQQPLKSSQVSFTEWLRLTGADLMKKGEYVKAYGVYTQAIKLSLSPEDLIKFKLNKAISCLKLNLTKQYCQLSEEVLKIDPRNPKGLYHQAKARAILGDMSYGDKLIQSSQINEASKKDLIKFLQIEKSFRSGKINWYEAIRSSETGSFTNNGVKIRKGSFGVGNFATRLIKAGELIYVQKPFLCQTFKLFNGLFTNKSDKDIIISLATELYSYSDEFK